MNADRAEVLITLQPYCNRGVTGRYTAKRTNHERLGIWLA
jgi:hypothetical protein